MHWPASLHNLPGEIPLKRQAARPVDDERPEVRVPPGLSTVARHFGPYVGTGRGDLRYTCAVPPPGVDGRHR